MFFFFCFLSSETTEPRHTIHNSANRNMSKDNAKSANRNRQYMSEDNAKSANRNRQYMSKDSQQTGIGST